MRYNRDQLEQRIEILQEYLGPRINYTSDSWPNNQIDRLLLEFLDILKRRYYNNVKRAKSKEQTVK
jgi:hypothetical protein